MYSFGTVIVFSLLALLIGITVGALAFRRFGGQSELARRLQDAEQKFKDYQADVTEHFAETSRRVNDLTRSYKDVHEYLASSAMKLTNPQLSRAITQSAQQNLPHGDEIDNAIEDYIDAEKHSDSNSVGESDKQETVTNTDTHSYQDKRELEKDPA